MEENENTRLLSVISHQTAALWAAECAEHVLPLFEEKHPNENRPRNAIGAVRSWVCGEVTVGEARKAAFAAHAAARELGNPQEAFVARACGHAAAAAHVKAHAKYAADYSIKASFDKKNEELWQYKRLKNSLISGIALRLEQPGDFREVEELTREAFWNVNVPGCDEHYLLHIMRDSKAFIPELDFVAVLDGKIVGNIVYTSAHIIDNCGLAYEVVIFGPISVLPEYQKIGIGHSLIEHTKKLARGMGYKAAVIYGEPEYYCRFGFLPAEKYSIRTKDNMYHAALLACELKQGALSGITGRFCEDSIFEIDQNKADDFDKSFPKKEKCVTPSQERFKVLSEKRWPE